MKDMQIKLQPINAQIFFNWRHTYGWYNIAALNSVEGNLITLPAKTPMICYYNESSYNAIDDHDDSGQFRFYLYLVQLLNNDKLPAKYFAESEINPVKNALNKVLRIFDLNLNSAISVEQLKNLVLNTTFSTVIKSDVFKAYTAKDLVNIWKTDFKSVRKMYPVIADTEFNSEQWMKACCKLFFNEQYEPVITESCDYQNNIKLQEYLDPHNTDIRLNDIAQYLFKHHALDLELNVKAVQVIKDNPFKPNSNLILKSVSNNVHNYIQPALKELKLKSDTWLWQNYDNHYIATADNFMLNLKSVFVKDKNILADQYKNYYQPMTSMTALRLQYKGYGNLFILNLRQLQIIANKLQDKLGYSNVVTGRACYQYVLDWFLDQYNTKDIGYLNNLNLETEPDYRHQDNLLHVVDLILNSVDKTELIKKLGLSEQTSYQEQDKQSQIDYTEHKFSEIIAAKMFDSDPTLSVSEIKASFNKALQKNIAKYRNRKEN